MVRKTFGIKEEEWEGKGWGEDKFFVHLKLKHMIEDKDDSVRVIKH